MMEKGKFYFMDGTEDVVMTWINTSKWSFPIMMLLIILACGLLGC